VTVIDTLAIARNLRARGFSVIPLDHPDETTTDDPQEVGKVPVVRWKEFQTTPATDDILRRWFGNGHKRNIGIATGRVSGVVVVDADSAEGLEWMRANLPPTPIRTRTAKGEHWFFGHPGPPVRNKARIHTGNAAVKIDIRADGGQVVAPGSKHVTGVIYEPIGTWGSISDLPMFDPSWLELEASASEPEAETRRARERADRKDVLRRARAYLDAIPPAIEGDGGDTHTFQVTCRVVRGFDLNDADALEVLRPWNARCAPPWSESELRDKIAGARKYGTEPIGELASRGLILNPNDPLPSAREFVARAHTIDDTLALRHQSHVFLSYERSAGAYVERDEASVRADLYAFLEPAKRRGEEGKVTPFQPTRSKVENVLDALRAVTNLPASMAAPCWLQNDPGLRPLDVLACPNGLLHIPTRTLHPPTPDFFTLNAIDFAYDPWAPKPRQWFVFLKSLWPEDDESIETVQELFGYLLTPDTRFQKIFLVVGPPRSGKGIKGRILRCLVGERNACSPTLAAFGRDFGKHVLIGKTVALISDARIGGRTDTASVAETLLSISGEDAQTVERKFLPDWNGKLSTRFVLLTNELPRITDVSGALAKRFIVLALQNSFYGKEDLGLYDRLVPELPGILLWALEGRDRLCARGHFRQPASAQELIQEFVDLGSPEATFLRQRTRVEPGASVAQRELFAEWVQWCAENGRDKPGTAQTFGRNVRAALPWVTTRQLGARGEQERHWEGLRLLERAASQSEM
jgi:putative DNA primase/helicase